MVEGWKSQSDDGHAVGLGARRQAGLAAMASVEVVRVLVGRGPRGERDRQVPGGGAFGEIDQLAGPVRVVDRDAGQGADLT
jgi:hypothetical protein